MARAGYEIKAVLIGATIVLVYASAVILNPHVEARAFLQLFGAYAVGIFSPWLLAVLIAVAIKLFRAWKPGGEAPPPIFVVRDYFLTRWQRDYLLTFVWPPLLFAFLMASFNTFKQLVLPGAGFRHDRLFADLDKMLFLGHDPWRITHKLLPWPQATHIIDMAYHAWFVPMSIGVLICSFVWGNYRLRTQYLLSYILVWIVMGSILAYLLSAAGPCFYHAFVDHSGRFDQLMAQLNADLAAIRQGNPAASIVALQYQQSLLKLFGQSALAIGGGISAMPSVHNGLAILFACAAFQINRVAGWVMVLYAAVIWVGSIHLGWHYAIDGLISLPLTVGMWMLMGRVADLLVQTSVVPVKQPAAVSAV